jgi:crotonobetainyl-CoA:carnitine CoA-transferase CaiB-like acyl-CoA transferase
MRVLDAGIWRPVPHATRILADLGAEVVKLEPPGGDPMRAFPELFRDLAAHARSIEVDLRTDEGRAHVRALAAESDVFCEGWRPGVAARLGVGYDDLRAVQPAIVYCSLSGYGQDGPLAARPGHDVNYQALAGALAPRAGRGDAPGVPRLPVADLAGATVLALVVCAAWARKLRTGEGEYVDVAMADVVASWVGPWDAYTVRGRAEPARGSAGYGVYRCADGGFVTLAVISEDHFWEAVCDALGLGALRGLGHLERLDRLDECDAAVRDAIARLSRDEAVARLETAGAPVAPVLTPAEMAAHPHFRERGVVVERADGSLGTGFPARLARHPARSGANLRR